MLINTLFKIFYLTFLGLFSYVLLFQYKYVDKENNNTQNETNQSNFEMPNNAQSNHFLSVFEMILFIWVSALVAQELNQVLKITFLTVDCAEFKHLST